MVGEVAAGLAIGKGVLEFLEHVKHLKGSEVISALFSWDGTRLSGSDGVEIVKHDVDEPGVWLYSVQEKDGYTFVRMPTVPTAVVELLGTVKGESNPDARYWRWVGNREPGVIAGPGSPNAKTDFVVIGYRPKALVDHFS